MDNYGLGTLIAVGVIFALALFGFILIIIGLFQMLTGC